MPLKSKSIILMFLLGANLVYGQRPPVTWNYKLDRLNADEWILKMEVSLALGWHIYSQHLGDGGPIPTRIKANRDDDYTFIGRAEEKGSADRFYDSLYEMEITWYTGQISFLQRIYMHRMIPEIQGVIEYMVCNSSQCLAQEEKFTINVRP